MSTSITILTFILLHAESIKHDGTALSNAQAFLHSAWLGDAVTVNKSLVSYFVN